MISHIADMVHIFSIIYMNYNESYHQSSMDRYDIQVNYKKDTP